MPRFRVNRNITYNREEDDFVYIEAADLPSARRKFLRENPTSLMGWVEELDDSGQPVRCRWDRRPE